MLRILGLSADNPRVSFEILLIDDNADMHLMIRACLEEPDLRITDAYTGEEGLRLAAANRCDLIVLDVAMPGMDGFEVLKQLKAASRLSDVPVEIGRAHV